MTAEQEAKIKEYVAKYANKHKLTFEEAKEHVMCKLYSEYAKQGCVREVPHWNKPESDKDKLVSDIMRLTEEDDHGC